MKSFKAFIIIVIFIIIASVGIYFATKSASNKEGEKKTTEEVLDTSNAKDIGAIFFYGSTCPHCKKVEQYITDNKVLTKIKIDQKEVYGNQDNAKLMQDYQNKCTDLSADDKGGVPFLYTPDKCIVGDQPIIDFFNAEIEKLK